MKFGGTLKKKGGGGGGEGGGVNKYTLNPEFCGKPVPDPIRRRRHIKVAFPYLGLIPVNVDLNHVL